MANMMRRCRQLDRRCVIEAERKGLPCGMNLLRYVWKLVREMKSEEQQSRERETRTARKMAGKENENTPWRRVRCDERMRMVVVEREERN